MNGLTLKENENQSQLFAVVDTLVFEPPLDLAAFEEFVKNSEFSHYTLSKDNILSLSEEIDQASSEGDNDEIEKLIGEAREHSLELLVTEDEMSATLKIVTSESESVPKMSDIIDLLRKQGVTYGIGKKRIRTILQKLIDAEANTELEQIVALGLSPRKGKDSIVKPMMPNALDRVLAPQKLENDKVDMRNLGDILCVSVNQAVAKRIPPTKGRLGKTVTGKPIETEPGAWKVIKLTENTFISPKNKNIVLSKISGQPKFENGAMTIDDTFVTKGVNVGTGNINYSGSVIVNGDVTENMEIKAKGDVTINGFVESAFVRSDGDIIITEGATGKMHDEDCKIIAKGNVFIQHAQGVHIISGKDLTVAKQLAYSQVKCKGSIIIGDPKNPMGNLFASDIVCYGTVSAGSVGAVSGSALNIDFSEGFNALSSRLESLHTLNSDLVKNNADHEILVSKIQSKTIPQSLKLKLEKLTNELELERVLMTWLNEAQNELESKKNYYETNIRVIANKELFPGVSLKLNKQNWKGDREYQRCRIIFEDGAWVYSPMV